MVAFPYAFSAYRQTTKITSDPLRCLPDFIEIVTGPGLWSDET